MDCKIVFVEKKLPNGDACFELYAGREKIGFASIAEDGRFLAQGRRKSVETIEDAARQVIENKIKKCMKEHERLKTLLSHLK